MTVFTGKLGYGICRSCVSVCFVGLLIKWDHAFHLMLMSIEPLQFGNKTWSEDNLKSHRTIRQKTSVLLGYFSVRADRFLVNVKTKIKIKAAKMFSAFEAK